jgi:hypothetical protein
VDFGKELFHPPQAGIQPALAGAVSNGRGFFGAMSGQDGSLFLRSEEGIKGVVEQFMTDGGPVAEA